MSKLMEQTTLIVFATSFYRDQLAHLGKMIRAYAVHNHCYSMNRSFVLKIIEDSTKQNQFKAFKKLKKHFINYVNGLQIASIDLKQEQLEKLKDKVSEESLWFQFLLTMKFWRDDTSKGFEKTDIYIE